ncbi:TolC family protein [Candidatus Poribacteria bacterium]|nr:TolC family protein [Candidatus Poribacteria bacterium]
MKFSSKKFLFKLVFENLCCLLAIIAGLFVLCYKEVWSQEFPQPLMSMATLKLEDLEQMALENNPTLAQTTDAVRIAEGQKIQAGLYPNPKLGYAGEDIGISTPFQRSQHYLFIEQRVVIAGKLKHRRNVLGQAQAQAEMRQVIQKIRVLNDLQHLYYEALGAQKFLELRQELARIAREAVETTEQLYNIGQADQPDLLAAEIEEQQVELDLASAMSELERIWGLLAVLIGKPELPRAYLLGDFEIESSKFNQETVLDSLLRESPEVKMALLGVERAKSSLQRAKAERFPDLFLRGGFGYNREVEDFQMLIEVGIPLPLFDRNQGNIASAKAELDSAEHEVSRLKLALRAQLESVVQSYLNLLRRVERYQTEILPRAQKAYDLYQTSFQQMAAAYPQVLIAQRTLFQLKTDYVRALVALWQSVVRIQGMLLTGGLNAPGDATFRVDIEFSAMPGFQNNLEEGR